MEVIIVDDNSPDGTQDRVKDLQRIYGSDSVVLAARAGKLGLGSAYIHGLERCQYDYVVLMDADLSHHVSTITLRERQNYLASAHTSDPYVYFSSSAQVHPTVHRQDARDRRGPGDRHKVFARRRCLRMGPQS